MASRVYIRPKLLIWACERAGFDLAHFKSHFPQLGAWVNEEKKPTLKQLERFAKATRTPVGFLFLQEPPIENIPIPDFRIMASKYYDRPSPDLLDTIYICQQRQEWYREFEMFEGAERLPFVGSAKISDNIVETAARIRTELGFELEQRRQLSTWTEALRHFIQLADEKGVLVMVNGVVGSNNRRKLDAREFRGFSLVDALAPLVFINGTDTKAAQMFTLAHELAHIWLGESGVSDSDVGFSPRQDIEQWCNRLAAELLVPIDALKQTYNAATELHKEIARLARHFKVSTLVILRRIYDIGGLDQNEYWDLYEMELERLLAIPRGKGGNFYLTLAARVSTRFARALVISTLEGRTLHRDALGLLGFSKLATFRELGNKVGVL